jgi:hypothetical protein
MVTICVQTRFNPARNILEIPCFLSANNKHSLLQSLPIHFPTILFEITHYSNTHEQQPYCVETFSQMTERPADRSVRQKTGWLVGGPLLRVTTIRRTTDTHTTDTHYRHTLQTQTTETHYRHTLQTQTTDTHYRHTLQTHTTDTHYRHTLQKHTTDTNYRNTLQTQTTDTHYRHKLQTHTTDTHTTDTFLFISHTTNVLLFKFRLQYLHSC